MKKFQMLYLYTPANDNVKQSDSPPTEMDLLLVESGLLQVYRWYVDAYEHLTLIDGKAGWERVDDAELCQDAEEEIGKYHA